VAARNDDLSHDPIPAPSRCDRLRAHKEKAPGLLHYGNTLPRNLPSEGKVRPIIPHSRRRNPLRRTRKSCSTKDYYDFGPVVREQPFYGECVMTLEEFTHPFFNKAEEMIPMMVFSWMGSVRRSHMWGATWIHSSQSRDFRRVVGRQEQRRQIID
jgi:hypothetical protein